MTESLINVNGENVQALEILFLTTMITLLPSLLVMMTSFTRYIISFSFLRSAIGTQQTPPNMVLVGMALFLTLFTMAPVVTQIQTEAYEPYKQEEISQEEFLDRAQVPLKEFMLRNTKTSTLNMFCDLAKVELPENVNMEEAVKLPLRVVVPSFMTCELQRAFEIGLLLYIPFKLLLFVTVNGWELLFSSLVQSFK